MSVARHQIGTEFPEGRGEASLEARGVAVPADHSIEWVRAWTGRGRQRTVEVWSEGGEECRCSIVVDVGRSRALPGHALWRVDRLGGYADVGALEAALVEITAEALATPRVVEVSLGLAGRDGDKRALLAARASAAGYRRSADPRGYDRTSCIDLGDPLDRILARATVSCRRGIRAVEKRPMQVLPIDDPALAPRLLELEMEAMQRTGGPPSRRSWASVIDYARRRPASARLTGMYSTEGPRRLLAFVLALRQGDHVEYRAAASTRAGGNAPLGYALAWDVITWAKEAGAEWFDFGGLPSDEQAQRELAGIVRFKESFGGEPIAFREEWRLDPKPVLASVRRGLSAGAHWLGGVRRRG